jgi:tyrosyl-tRNA synthetase
MTAGKDAAWLTRDAVDCLPAGALEAKLARAGQLRVKLGIDPTAPDIHLGHTVVLRKLREFQDLGHLVVLIIGDYTARVGDPSGRSELRPVLSGAEIDANARTFQEQAFTVLDRERVEVRRNSEWLDMSMEQLFRLARTTTVAQMIERDDFAKRLAAGTPVSLLELFYPLLQGYDSVEIRADVELGGTDQKFNLLLGRDIQRAYGVPEQVALTMPILPGTDGVRRMSKSLRNYIGVTDPPDEMYGKTMSIPDSALEVWSSLLLGAAPDPQIGPRDAKRAPVRARAPRPRRPSTRSTSRARLRRRYPPSSGRCQTGWSTSRPCSRRRSASRPRRPGGRWRAAACASTGRRSTTARSMSRRRPSTGGCCNSASAASRASNWGEMAVHGGMLRMETPGNGHIVDLTEGVASVVRTSGAERGVVTVFATGSTVAVTTMEYEPGGVNDLQALLDRLVPAQGDYAHNRLNHDTNAHAHLRAALIGPSESVPLVDGRLALGTWQQIVLIDFDDRPRTRTVTVQVAS